MSMDTMRTVVTRRPGLVVGFWAVLTLAIGLAAPDLTRLAADGQAHLLDEESESAKGAEIVRQAWPDQSYESQVVLGLYRVTGLTADDRAFARRLADRFDLAEGKPTDIITVLGPKSRPPIADRLISPDKTLELIAVRLSTSFVAPTAEATVVWLQGLAADPALATPQGLELKWTGDAVIGRDYMRNVQTTLDRAAMATVVLLLCVLLMVYRSLWLAIVPLATIGVCVVISRGVLAWATMAGWEISPLVELFLIVLLFGSGTDFCLFISWRFGEHWDPKNPAGAMRVTLRRGAPALLTSAGTVFAGLMLMGTTKFKLFSSTGPSVALGLVITLIATLTLTPALLVILAKRHPRAFEGMTRPSSGFWEHFAHRVLARPLLSWLAGLILMAPLAWLGTRTTFTQDTLLEMPSDTASAEGLRLVAKKFGPGLAAPLTIVMESKTDLRESSGLALIDDTSRMLARQKFLTEVRSATQPLGSPAPLDPARLSNRLAAVNDGFHQIETGADTLRDGLDQGLTKLKAARWLLDRSGVQLPTKEPTADEARANREAVSGGFKQAGRLLFDPGSILTSRGKPKAPAVPETKPDPTVEQLTQAVAGAGQLSDGVKRAEREISNILADPVGRRALDRLLITPETVRDHPELRESFATYITSDGKLARFDVTQDSRMFSAESMDEVLVLRRKLADRLDEHGELPDVRALVTGPTAESADIRTMTNNDQIKSWFVIPIGVFVVLILALRDPLACINLVVTMLLTYLFALGATHFLFITVLGSEGLDWKVPYFLFVLLVAVGVDYNVFLMARLHEETGTLGLRAGISRAVAQTGGLISSAAAITAISFASLMFSPLASLRQLGFALVIGIGVDAMLVRPLLVPCGQWLMNQRSDSRRMAQVMAPHLEPVAHATH